MPKLIIEDDFNQEIVLKYVIKREDYYHDGFESQISLKKENGNYLLFIEREKNMVKTNNSLPLKLNLIYPEK